MNVDVVAVYKNRDWSWIALGVCVYEYIVCVCVLNLLLCWMPNLFAAAAVYSLVCVCVCVVCFKKISKNLKIIVDHAAATHRVMLTRLTHLHNILYVAWGWWLTECVWMNLFNWMFMKRMCLNKQQIACLKTKVRGGG